MSIQESDYGEHQPLADLAFDHLQSGDYVLAGKLYDELGFWMEGDSSEVFVTAAIAYALGHRDNAWCNSILYARTGVREKTDEEKRELTKIVIGLGKLSRSFS